MNFCYPIILLFILFQNPLNIQKDLSELYNEGISYLDRKDYERAIENFNKIIDSVPYSFEFAKSYCHLGEAYFRKGNYDKAIPIYLHILDTTKLYLNNKNKYVDPFGEYRYDVCISLCDIYLNKNMPDSSLYYLDLTENIYTFRSFWDIPVPPAYYRAIIYARVYHKLNNDDKAINILLQYVLQGIPDELSIIDELKPLLQEKSKIMNVKEEYEKAINNIQSKIITKHGESETIYYFTFLNTIIQIPYYFLDKEFNRERTILFLKSNAFYVMICQLNK